MGPFRGLTPGVYAVEATGRWLEMADAPTDPRLVEQQVLKGDWELRKMAFDTQVAELKAVLPTLPALTSGKVDAGEEPSPIGVIGVFKAVDRIAEEMVKRCSELDVTKVRISADDVTGRERQAHDIVTAMIARIGHELDDLEKLLAPPAESGTKDFIALPLVLAASMVSSLLPAVASLLESNTVVRSKDVNLDVDVVAAGVAGRLRKAGHEVAFGAIGVPQSRQLHQQVRAQERRRQMLEQKLVEFVSEAADQEESLTAYRDALKTVLNEQAKTKGLSELQDLLSEIKDVSDQISAAKLTVRARDQRAARARANLDAISAVVTALTAVSGERSVLDLADAYSETKAYASLIINPVYGGASSVYEEKVGKDRGLHVGSAVASFMLVDPDGQLRDAGVLTAQAAATSTMGSSSVDWKM